MKRRLLLAGMILFFVLLGVYVGGVLAQLFGGGGISYGLFTCLGRGFRTRLTILSYLLFVGFALVIRNRAEDDVFGANFVRSKKGTFGTAGYMQKSESKEIVGRKRNFHGLDGFILGEENGEIIYLPKESYLNRNFAVCGSQGSMKSRSFSRNMILQCAVRGDSMFITDPKSELYEDTAAYLESAGYTVKQFNLIDMLHSDAWDCLGEVKDGELMDIFVDVIIRNTTDEFDPFHDNIEMDLLKALCLYVKENYPEDRQGFSEVYNLLQNTDPDMLDDRFARLPAEHPARGPYMLFSKADKIKGNAVAGLGTRLQIMQNEKVQALTSYRDIDLELPGKEKCAYFCIVSDQDSTYDVLATLFVSFFFIRLVRFADSLPDRKLPVPVHMIMDEFPSLGVVPDFKKKLATARSRGIGIDMIFQNLPQMKNRYPDEQWEELLGGCDITIFLGCNDLTTAEYFSRRCGEITVETESTRRDLNTIRVTDYVSQYATTTTESTRMLLTPDEILRLPLKESLVIIRGNNVMRLQKLDYTRHPLAKALRLRKTADHIPVWYGDFEKKQRAKEREDFFETERRKGGQYGQDNRWTAQETGSEKEAGGQKEEPVIVRRSLDDFRGFMKR